MGIKSNYLNFMFDTIGTDVKRICELGNQRLKWDDENLTSCLSCLGVPNPAELTSGKQVFSSMGWEHCSIDINGRDGSMPMDLCQRIEEKTQLLNRFDVVTNFGTSEHVANQYMCFLNIHNLCQIGGLMVHIVSADPNHGSWNYDDLFFKRLAKSCGYEMVQRPEKRAAVKDNHISCIMRKVERFFVGQLDFQGPIRVGDFVQYRLISERRLASC